MGLIGLAIWCHTLPPQDVLRAVREYTLLIHPNEVVAFANGFYALMVQFLLNNFGDQDRARKSFDYAKA
jgi:hypothetical protein